MQESVRATWPSMQSVALTYVRQHTEILREIYMGPRVDTSGDVCVCVYMRENIYLNICPQRVAKNLNVCVYVCESLRHSENMCVHVYVCVH